MDRDDLPVARSVRPSRVAAANGMKMVNTSILAQSTQGAAATAIEARAPELRFLRTIQISQQHNIVIWQDQQTTVMVQLAPMLIVWSGQYSPVTYCNYSFECNICLDTAKQPVVTPSAGHACTSGSMHRHPSLSALSARERCWKRMSLRYTKQAVMKGFPPPTLTCHPRPRANRRDSLSQQLQMADTRGIATVVRELIQNQGVVRGLPILEF